MQSNIDSLEEKLQTIPTNPGCYIYKDNRGKIIYIGKAKNLKKRVWSYFSPSIDHAPRIEQMITKIHDIEYHIVDTELESLVLEANLIKKYRPKYNVMMKDDKSYTWIQITTKDEYPTVQRIRDTDKRDDGNTYFGPYPDSTSVYNILKMLRKIFPFRTCDYDLKENEPIKRSRLCLYYHIGLCPGPCDHLIEKIEYRQEINRIVRFLRGDNKAILDEFRKDMQHFSDTQQYEQAASMRDKINDILYVTQRISLNTHVDEDILEKRRSAQISSGLAELFDSVHARNNNNFRMECYDISNIQGTNPVGAMVVFENGIAKKSDYRKFKIRTLHTPNDFVMMKEMLTRRFAYITGKESKDSSFTTVPDLIIIDGGKGQLSSAVEVLDSYNVHIPIFGLAKREELIFFPNNPTPLKLKRDSPALFLIQRIRDESHRFGITFHRNLRSKQALATPLDGIKGIGPATKKKLLKKFKSFSKIQQATDEELREIVSEKIIAALRLSVKTSSYGQ